MADTGHTKVAGLGPLTCGRIVQFCAIETVGEGESTRQQHAAVWQKGSARILAVAVKACLRPLARDRIIQLRDIRSDAPGHQYVAILETREGMIEPSVFHTPGFGPALRGGIEQLSGGSAYITGVLAARH